MIDIISPQLFTFTSYFCVAIFLVSLACYLLEYLRKFVDFKRSPQLREMNLFSILFLVASMILFGINAVILGMLLGGIDSYDLYSISR